MRTFIAVFAFLSIAACQSHRSGPTMSGTAAPPLPAIQARTALAPRAPNSCDVSLPAPTLAASSAVATGPVGLGVQIRPWSSIPPGTYFAIYRSNGGPFERIGFAMDFFDTAGSYRDITTQPNTKYSYRATVWSQGCESAPSNVVSINVTTPEPNVRVDIVPVGGSSANVTLSATTGVPGVDSFNFYSSITQTLARNVRRADGIAVFFDTGRFGTYPSFAVSNCRGQDCVNDRNYIGVSVEQSQPINLSYDFGTGTLRWDIRGTEFAKYLIEADCGAGFEAIGLQRGSQHAFVDPRIAESRNCNYRVTPYASTDRLVVVYYQASSAFVPSGGISTGLFFSGGTGYYANAASHYCGFGSFGQYLNAGGPPDTNSVRRYDRIPGSMTYDGLCSTRAPAGFFFALGTGYYANEAGHYCGFVSWETYLAAGGPRDTRTVATYPYVPSSMISDGVCLVPAQSYAATGFFNFGVTSYYLNPAGHICSFSSYAQFVAAASPVGVGAVPQFTQLTLDPNFFDGRCLVRAIGYLDSQPGENSISGWALDPNSPTRSIQVHVYTEGVGIAVLTTDLARPDVNSDYRTDGVHGFRFSVPPAYRQPGRVFNFYAVGVSGTSNLPLINSPWTFR